MANLSKRVKFLSIIAALGSVGGVANAGNNNENRNSIKNEIRKLCPTAKKLLKDAGLIFFGAIGDSFLLTKNKEIIKKYKEHEKNKETPINKIVNLMSDGYFLPYQLFKGTQITTNNCHVYNLYTFQYNDILSQYQHKLENNEMGFIWEFLTDKNINFTLLQEYDLKNNFNFKIVNGEVSVELNEESVKTKTNCNKETQDKLKQQGKTFQKLINKNKFLKEMILNTLKKHESFKKDLENESTCPIKFVVTNIKDITFSFINNEQYGNLVQGMLRRENGFFSPNDKNVFGNALKKLKGEYNLYLNFEHNEDGECTGFAIYDGDEKEKKKPVYKENFKDGVPEMFKPFSHIKHRFKLEMRN